MRRLPARLAGAPSPLGKPLLGAVVAVLAALVAVAPASAAYAVDPSPTTTAGAGEGGATNIGPATAGEAVCSVTAGTNSPALVSGMVATDKGTLVVESKDTDTLKIFTLDATCKSTVKSYALNPRSPQDLAVDGDGAIWVADTGDDANDRPSISFHKIAAGASTAVPNRVTFPDGSKPSSAFVLDGDGLPIVFARVSGKAGVAIYKPTKALVPNAQPPGVPALAKVGEFVPDKTGTSTPTASVGNSVVTGAAKSPDGKKVVIRTYSDAYEWDVADGDVVKAITGTKPRVTRLPDEPQGEAISYSVDGTKFLTLSAKPTGATENPKLLSYTPFVPTAGGGGGGAENENVPSSPGSDQSWFSQLTFSELTRIVAAVGVVGLVLAIAGIIGIRRARKRRREEEDGYDDDYDDYDRPRRGRGRGPRDDGYGGGGRYAEGYGEQGYADAGYGGNGYGGAYDYAQQQGGYPPNGQANGYGGYGDQYAGQQPGYDQYGGGGYDQYGQPAQQYGADQYGGQQYGGDYGGGQYGPEQYGGGQQYGGGYGYEEEFDPLQDPRRR